MDWKPLQVGFSNRGSLNGDRVCTYIEGVEFIPGGCYATINEKEGFVEKRYWDIRNYFSRTQGRVRPVQYYIDEYARLIEDSVEKRLMSDVPIGSFLSGGLDSALVTAIAARKNKDIHCFHALEKTTFVCGDSEAARALSSKMESHFTLFSLMEINCSIKWTLNSRILNIFCG